MSVKVYIVEDEPIIAAIIASNLKKEGFEVLGSADNMKTAFFDIDDLQPDLVFVDITLGDEQDGIKLGQKLNDKTSIPFIYLTSHSDKSTLENANATNPAGYLLKPFKSTDLKVAIELALLNATSSNTNKNSAQHLFLKQNRQWIKLDQKEIIFLKADDTYTEIYTDNNRFVVSHSLKKVEENLNADEFLRVHRSYIVNLNRIKVIEDDTIVFDVSNEKTFIPVGKTYKKSLQEMIKFL